MTFEIIWRNYRRGLWNRAQVEVCFRKGLITKAQFDTIIAGGTDAGNGDRA